MGSSTINNRPIRRTESLHCRRHGNGLLWNKTEMALKLLGSSFSTLIKTNLRHNSFVNLLNSFLNGLKNGDIDGTCKRSLN